MKLIDTVMINFCRTLLELINSDKPNVSIGGGPAKTGETGEMTLPGVCTQFMGILFFVANIINVLY